MIRSFATIFLSIALLACLISACGINRQNLPENSSLTTPESKLESGQPIDRQLPFTQRDFVTYLEGKWIGQAVSYGCYRENQAPWADGPSKAEILEDLNIIVKHWNLIRVYNADDDTQNILEVIEANNLPLKLMLGVWLENESDSPQAKASNVSNVLRAIELANRFPGIVAAVNVGNETQVFWSGHKMAREALIRYIRIVRAHTSVPVTTADDYNFWNKPESTTVVAEVDFIVTHIYPLWNGKTLEESINWLDTTYRELKLAHPNKLIVLGEIGWATAYNPEKKGDGEQGTLIKGKVSVAAQEKFLLELDTWVNSNLITTFLFEAFDEPWKGGGKETKPNEIEKNWGVFYHDRTPKQSFTNYLAQKEPKQ